MRKSTLLLCLIIPFVVMVIVNSSLPKPSTKQNTQQCTRYCHNHSCLHFNQRFVKVKENIPDAEKLRKLYVGNIQWLHQNGIGLSYQNANLFIYVVLFPCLSLLLIWGLLRKR